MPIFAVDFCFENKITHHNRFHLSIIYLHYILHISTHVRYTHRSLSFFFFFFLSEDSSTISSSAIDSYIKQEKKKKISVGTIAVQQ